MNNSKALFQEFLHQTSSGEDMEDLRSVAYLVFENIFGLSRTDILAEKTITSAPEKHRQLDHIVQRLRRHEPIQYILGEADFCGRKFFVNPSVLIPRPETEELVENIKHEIHSQNIKNPKILDIGTGSGCIPITLSLDMRGAAVYASDVSKDALAVAQQNATALKASVTFIEHDILKAEIPFGDFDIIVSNPPYITMKEKGMMMKHVVEHEPHLALFVPDQDPLLFYKVIAAKAKRSLKHGGSLWMEINAQSGEAVAQLFMNHGFSMVMILKDLSGNERIVKGVLM